MCAQIDFCRHLLSESRSKKLDVSEVVAANRKRHEALQKQFGEEYATLEEAPPGLTGITPSCDWYSV